jgi:hypothetical protein
VRTHGDDRGVGVLLAIARADAHCRRARTAVTMPVVPQRTSCPAPISQRAAACGSASPMLPVGRIRSAASARARRTPPR